MTVSRFTSTLLAGTLWFSADISAFFFFLKIPQIFPIIFHSDMSS